MLVVVLCSMATRMQYSIQVVQLFNDIKLIFKLVLPALVIAVQYSTAAQLSSAT